MFLLRRLSFTTKCIWLRNGITSKPRRYFEPRRFYVLSVGVCICLGGTVQRLELQRGPLLYLGALQCTWCCNCHCCAERTVLGYFPSRSSDCLLVELLFTSHSFMLQNMWGSASVTCGRTLILLAVQNRLALR
jgi:hypothetical protein